MSKSNVTPKERLFVYAFSDPPNALVSNGVEQLSLYARCEGIPPVVCTFKRSEGTGNPPHIIGYDQPIPVRLPSALPPPGNLTLQLHLGAKVGRGRTSGVYDAAIDFPSSSPELAELAVPPLVVKISRPGREQAMDNEAFFYEEMESLQGVVIARYYGFFKGELPPGYTLDGEDNAPCEEDRVSESQSTSEESSCTSFSDPEPEKQGSQLSRDESQARQHLDGPRLVSILVLERLGGKLPIGHTLPPKTDLDLLGMYSHLSRLGIDHVDIRHANILEAPLCPPGWPCLVSSTANFAYRYRLVDFDNSKKTDRPLYVFDTYYRQYVSRLLNCLSLGFVIEPWEF